MGTGMVANMSTGYEKLMKLNQAILDQDHNLGCPSIKEWKELVKLTLRTVDGVIVDQLPTIGEAENIKTHKQGRMYTIKNLMKPIHTGKGRYTGTGENLITKAIKLTNPDEMKLMAKNLIEHKKTSPKQKAVAQDFLDCYPDINEGNINQWAIDCKEAQSYEYGEYQKACSLIRSIARTIAKYERTL